MMKKQVEGTEHKGEEVCDIFEPEFLDFFGPVHIILYINV